jgi:signal peptide peptidase-like protein 3
MTLLWVLTGHWILFDLIAVSIATLTIQLIRLPSLKLAVVFLTLLLAYDVFWVFASSSIFNANVMIEVATKKSKSPIAIVADKFNLPHVAKSQPSLPLPGKVMIPSSYSEEDYSMLGLGDIVLPGLLVCLSVRFDNLMNSTPFVNNNYHYKCSNVKYFVVAIIGYALGLLSAMIAVQITHYPQPALLYLVPSTLIPLLVKSFLQGHFKLMWDGTPLNQPNNSSTKLTV